MARNKMLVKTKKQIKARHLKASKIKAKVGKKPVRRLHLFFSFISVCKAKSANKISASLRHGAKGVVQ